MLLSIQRIVVLKAIAWCNEKSIAQTPFNIVAALDALGYLKVSIPVEENFETSIIKCEMCSNTATCAVVDTKWHNDRHSGVKEFEPDGGIHYFCALHSRSSVSTYGGDINII